MIKPTRSFPGDVENNSFIGKPAGMKLALSNVFSQN